MSATKPRTGVVLVFGLGLLASVLLAHHGLLLSGLQRLPGNLGDVRFNHFLLEHEWRWLHRQAPDASLWDLPIFFPARNTLAYSDTLLGVAPFYWAWRTLGLEPLTAYACWLLTLSALNFAAMAAWLHRGLGLRPLSASAGAALFTAGASRLNQSDHPQLQSQLFCIVALAALTAYFGSELRGRRRGWLALAAGAAVAQLYAGFYWGWFLAFFCAVALTVALTRSSLRQTLFARLRSDAVPVLGITVVAAAAMWPLLHHYRDAASEVGFRQYGVGSLPEAASFFNLGPDSWLYGRLGHLHVFERMNQPWEQRVGLGLLTLGVTLFALWRERRRPVVFLLLVTSAVFLLLTLPRFHGIAPWWAVFHLFPGANGVRAVMRGGVWLLIPAAVGLAWFVERAPRRSWALVVCLLCLLEQGQQTPTFAKSEALARAERVARQVSSACPAFYMLTAPGENAGLVQLDSMGAVFLTGIPTANGYSGNEPPGWTLGVPASPARANLDAWLGTQGLGKESVCAVGP